jgi:hypothetical protein
MAKINVEIDDEDHIELKLSSTRHRTYLKDERLLREAKEGKPVTEGKAATSDKVEPDDSSAVPGKKKEVT